MEADGITTKSSHYDPRELTRTEYVREDGGCRVPKRANNFGSTPTIDPKKGLSQFTCVLIDGNETKVYQPGELDQFGNPTVKEAPCPPSSLPSPTSPDPSLTSSDPPVSSPPPLMDPVLQSVLREPLSPSSPTSPEIPPLLIAKPVTPGLPSSSPLEQEVTSRLQSLARSMSSLETQVSSLTNALSPLKAAVPQRPSGSPLPTSPSSTPEGSSNSPQGSPSSSSSPSTPPSPVSPRSEVPVEVRGSFGSIRAKAIQVELRNQDVIMVLWDPKEPYVAPGGGEHIDLVVGDKRETYACVAHGLNLTMKLGSQDVLLSILGLRGPDEALP